MMTFDQLRYFAEVARQGHLGRASRTLGISPSAVSHAITRLEVELGRDLFVHEGKRLFLTEHGKMLLERSEGILRSVATLRDDLQESGASFTGHVRVAATHGLASRWVAPAWGHVFSLYPRLTAEIFSLRTAEVVRAIALREIDLGFGYNLAAPSSVTMVTIARMRLVVAVRKGHPLLGKKAAMRPKHLAEYPSAAPKAFTGVENCESHPVLERWGVKPHTPLIFDDYAVAEALLETTDAWALIPEWVVKRAPGLTAAISPPATLTPLSVSAMWPKAHPPGRVLEGLIEQVKRRLAKDV